MSSVHLIYRLAPAGKPEVRPAWFRQQACLRTFLGSVDAARVAGMTVRTTIVVDGDVDADLEADIARFDAVDRVQYRGNSPAFRHAFDLACSSPEQFVFFAEDDYVWTTEAIESTLLALAEFQRAGNSVGYITPYAHPLRDDDELPDVSRHDAREFVHGEVTWRSTPQNTMTFACSTKQLRNDRHVWWLASYGKSPKDAYGFWTILEGRWFKLVANAAFRDVRRVLNIDSIRLIGGSTLKRFGVGVRPLLVQPVDSLATHVHEPYLTGTTDWERLARGTTAPPT